MRPAHGELAGKDVRGVPNDASVGALRGPGARTSFPTRSGPFRSRAATWVLQAPRTSAAAGAPSRRQGREAGLRRPPGRRSRRTRSTGGRSRARVAPAPPLPPPPPDPPAPRPGASAAAVFEGAGGTAPRARIRRKVRWTTLLEIAPGSLRHIQVRPLHFTSDLPTNDMLPRDGTSPGSRDPRRLDALHRCGADLTAQPLASGSSGWSL